MSDAVLYAVADGVATVTMNRPDAMNAADRAVRDGLRGAFEQAAEDDAVRAVLLTGAGRAFCVGQDLKELMPMYESNDPDLGTIVAGFNEVVTLLATLPKPTVAFVNGTAAGAGASLAFACDFRIAVETAAFAMAFANIGLVPDTGASWTLQRLVGLAKATEMIMLSQLVPAAAALEIGLVTRIGTAGEARAFAVELAAGPTVGYGYTKRLLAYAHTASLDDTLALEAELQAAAGRTEDHVNAVRSFLAKERPVFNGY